MNRRWLAAYYSILGNLKQQIMGKLTVISSPDLADCSLLSIERATSASVLKTDLPAYSRDSDDSM